MRAALAAADAGADVAVLSRTHPVRAGSVAAQGGINAALGEDDTPGDHARDTLEAGAGLGDRAAVEVLTVEAAARVDEAARWGCLFSRTPDGRIAQRPFGGMGFPRTCYAGDRTGQALVHTLYGRLVARRIPLYEEFVALELAVADGEVHGLVALDLRTGRLQVFAAGAVVLATGGAGRLYGRTTNSFQNTGSGMALAYRAGAALRDLEFVQFHPTVLEGSGLLITEAARAEGGRLLNARGERFMARYDPDKMELAARDLTARAIRAEIEAGRGFGEGCVHLDLTAVGRLSEKLGGLEAALRELAGIDPTREPVPVRPAQHYMMGGIATDIRGATEVKGLYAAGECACVSVHGANRLGGNSLLETLVFGRRAGEAAACGRELTRAGLRALVMALRETWSEWDRLRRATGPERVARLRRELGRLMDAKAGIVRDEEGLRAAAAALEELRGRWSRLGLTGGVRPYPLEALEAWELGGMLELARVVVGGALRRRESRGAHFRGDRPEADPAWTKHTLARRSGRGPRFEPEEVDGGGPGGA